MKTQVNKKEYPKIQLAPEAVSSVTYKAQWISVGLEPIAPIHQGHTPWGLSLHRWLASAR